jgi:hypothetical protein
MRAAKGAWRCGRWDPNCREQMPIAIRGRRSPALILTTLQGCALAYRTVYGIVPTLLAEALPTKLLAGGFSFQVQTIHHELVREQGMEDDIARTLAASVISVTARKLCDGL